MIKDDLPLLEPNEGVEMYRPYSNNSDINPTVRKYLCWHYVAITGVYINTFTGKTYLKIQSWGTSYYVDYEEFVDYNDHIGRSGMLFFVQDI